MVKDGNLSIPLYVARRRLRIGCNSAAPDGWLESAAKTRKSLQSLIIAADD
jgi:hypothetical protein